MLLFIILVKKKLQVKPISMHRPFLRVGQDLQGLQGHLRLPETTKKQIMSFEEGGGSFTQSGMTMLCFSLCDRDFSMLGD